MIRGLLCLRLDVSDASFASLDRIHASRFVDCHTTCERGVVIAYHFAIPNEGSTAETVPTGTLARVA